MSSLMDKICAQAPPPGSLNALPLPPVFTNDVFDVLHRGHVNCLNHAAVFAVCCCRIDHGM
jgi:bifunctional ADP-heptose synthase (sugar kinase/adenylyltransferase)